MPSFVVGWNKKTLSGLWFLSLIMAVAGGGLLWHIHSAARPFSAREVLPILSGSFFLLVFALYTVAELRTLFSHTPALILDSDGFSRYSMLGHHAVRLAWNDVRVLDSYTTGNGQLFVVVRLKDPKTYLDQLAPIKRWLARSGMRTTGSPLTIGVQPLQISFDQLMQQMNARLEAYRHPNRRDAGNATATTEDKPEDRPFYIMRNRKALARQSAAPVFWIALSASMITLGITIYHALIGAPGISHRPDPRLIAQTISLIFLGFVTGGLVYFTQYMSLGDSPALRLDKDEIIFYSFRYGHPGRLAWRDIAALGTYRGWFGGKYITIKLKHPERQLVSASLQARIRRSLHTAMTGAPILIPAKYLQIPFDDLNRQTNFYFNAGQKQIKPESMETVI